MCLSLCVSIEKLAKESAQRLRDRARDRRINSAKELFEGMSSAGHDVTFGGVQNIWYAKHLPNIKNAYEIADFLNWSLDEWFFGRPAQRLTKEDLLAVVAGMIEETGGTIPGDDPDIVRAAQLLMKIKDGEKKKAVVRMLEAFIGDTA